MRLLLVEDDPSLARGMRLALKPDRYTVDIVSDGQEALAALHDAGLFDAVILDLGLPRLDGLDVLDRVRRSGNTVPILVLTARDSIDDRVAGLDAGADDYLVKPFDVDELRARLRALLRRSHGRPNMILELAGIRLNPATMEVSHQGAAVSLARREFMLLQTFMSRPGHVFSRDSLSQQVYGWDEEVESNAIEVHVHHLRRKFGSGVIRTVRGVGYVMDPDR